MRILSIFSMLLALSACAPQPIQYPTATLLDSDGIPKTATAIPALIAEQAANLAVKDLSTRLGLDPSRIKVLSIESMSWADTALGCPRPGESYAQQTVPGYRLRLEADRQAYIYHTDADNTVILCPDDFLPSFPVTPGEIEDGEPWMPVD